MIAQSETAPSGLCDHRRLNLLRRTLSFPSTQVELVIECQHCRLNRHDGFALLFEHVPARVDTRQVVKLGAQAFGFSRYCSVSILAGECAALRRFVCS